MIWPLCDYFLELTPWKWSILIIGGLWSIMWYVSLLNFLLLDIDKASIREKSKISLDLVNLDNGIETEAITGPVYNLLRALISSNGLLLWAKCAQSQAVTPDIVMILLGLSSCYNLEVLQTSSALISESCFNVAQCTCKIQKKCNLGKKYLPQMLKIIVF